jgi:hypothetical protein
MTRAGLGLAGSRLPVSQLIIKPDVLGGYFSKADECHFLVGEVLETDRAAVTSLEALVFLDGEQYEAVASVAGDGHRLSQSLICQGAELILEFGQ